MAEIIYFRSDTLGPFPGLTTDDGKIDFGALGEKFKLEPKSITLCHFFVPRTKDDETKSEWKKLKEIFGVAGTAADPVMVGGDKAPVHAVSTVGGEESTLGLKEIEKLVEKTAEKTAEKTVRKLVPVRYGRKVRISEVSSSEWAQVQVDGGVKIESFQPSRPLVPFKPRKPWKVFDWDGSLTERQQSAQYIEHLSEFVDVESSDNAFADVAADKHFLDFFAFDREFVGTADVAISSRSSVGLAIPGNALRCIMELKKHLGKTMNSAASYQAIISLLLATMKYTETDAVAFLTDLRETWYIFWRDGATVFYYLFKSSDDAVGYLEHYLEFAAKLRANPSMVLDPDRFDGLDVLWRGKRQKPLPGIEEHPPADRLSELEGLLSVEEETYFDAHRLIHAVRSLPIFWNLSRQSLGLEPSGSGSEPPPFMYT